VWDLVRLGLLLARASGGRTVQGVRVERDERFSGGAVQDLFAPASEPRAGWVAVHGMTRNGKDDARLQRFAAALAGAGAVCAVPTLPGLADLRFEPADVDVLAEAVKGLAGRTGAPVSVVGFSYGGSYGLLAAADGDLGSHVRQLVAFGAYHSLVEVSRSQARFLAGRPESGPDRDEWLYMRLALAWRERQQQRLEEEAVAGLDAVLRRYCDAATAAEKEAAQARYCTGAGLAEPGDAALDPHLAATLSPAGRLGGLRCAVALVHDRDDVLVPANQAEALKREIAEASGASSVDLVLTTLLRHVRPTSMLRPFELLRLARVLRPLVR